MSKWIKITALTIAAVAVATLIYAVITPEESSTDSNHMGWGGHMTYSTSNVSMIAISIVVIVAALMVVLLWKEYEPLPPSMSPPVKPADIGRAAVLPQDKAELVIAETETPDERAAHNYLVLRLLSGDERTMYKAIMDSGGEALQKDLIVGTKMSNAKVSRVLDRLLAKDVITKERHGATNKVRIRLDR